MQRRTLLQTAAAAGIIGQTALDAKAMAAPPALQELIVVAAPRHDDPYYADVADAIVEFHHGLATRLTGGDLMLVLADRVMGPRYDRGVGPMAVVTAPMDDIWIRDYAPVQPDRPVLFRYTAAAQGGGRRGQRAADAVQQRLVALLNGAGVSVPRTDLLNDGGNFVDDGAGRAIVSRKILRDTRLSEDACRARLRAELGLDHVAFIPSDDPDGLAHADGMVAFVAPNTVILAAYPDDPAFEAAAIQALQAGLPGVEIHPLAMAPDTRSPFDDRFASACGLSVNAIVTPHRIYLPVFGQPEDAAAADRIAGVSGKPVIPIPTATVCRMGGGPRCLTWQLRGPMAHRMVAPGVLISE